MVKMFLPREMDILGYQFVSEDSGTSVIVFLLNMTLTIVFVSMVTVHAAALQGGSEPAGQ